MLLALLLAAEVAAPSTVLVVPFTEQGDLPRTAGVAVTEQILDAVVQANRDNFLTLKQLDAVLRRRDLRLDDPAVGGVALEMARALGAIDLITGTVSTDGDRLLVAGRRVRVSDGAELAANSAEGLRPALPALALQVGRALLKLDGTLTPMTSNAAALESAAQCETALARQSLGAHSRMTLPADKLVQAERTCKEALRLDYKLGLARAGLAVTLAVRGKFAESRKEAERARKERFVPLAALAEAFASRRQHDNAGFRAALQAAVDERPGFLHALGYLAEDRVEAGDDKEAVALFDRYLQRSPNHTWAMSKKARELAQLKQFDEAIELSEKALSLNPGDPELLIETASRYIDAGRDARAEPLLRQAMNAKPGRPAAALRLGYVYIRGHKLNPARDALEQAISMATREDEGKTRGTAHADLARVAAKQNRYVDAVEELQRARSEGLNKLPCDEPELARWKDRPELTRVCTEAAAASLQDKSDEDAVPVDL